ncbi:SpoIIE family protein phosphatase [Streptomyces tendae]|uniref:SpoIIE family protein phosphatase n=1 Tax=Streptomyces tendae TaxID=1932 RepID=UPI00249066D2|nr:SpoIIE family protein phosphatase [Streptomyces tendae]
MRDAVGDDVGAWPVGETGFWRRVVERLGTAVLVLDTAGRVIASNPAAERLLGRTAAAMRGADAHDLLHRDADGNEVPRDRCPLLHALAEGKGAQGEGGTYLRGDGRLLAVSWSASPLTEDGSVKGMALLFTDATGDRRVHREGTARTRALEDLNERLSLVAEITDVLGQTLETDEALARLVRLLVPRLADWAAVDLRTGSGEVHRVAVTGPEGRDAGFQGRSVPGAEGTGEAEDSPLGRALTGGESVLQERVAAVTPAAGHPPLAALHHGFLTAVGASSAVTVPLGARDRITGALTVVRTDPAHPFDEDDLAAVSDVGRRVGVLIDNTRRYGRQRAVAEAMQRNLLAPLPRPGHLRLAARYQPAPAGSQVGGDWYDAFILKDGALALVIGDVVGHDLTAAAGMAQLHGILRSLAWDHTGPPGAVVDRLDAAMPVITTVPLATLILARVEGDPERGPWTLRWTSAGHPPPLLLSPDGTACYLEAGQGLLLGTGPVGGADRPDATHPLEPGSTLLLYTDGLVETPGSDLDTGLDRLLRHALTLVDEPLDRLCGKVLAHLPPGSSDDVALLALRVPPP